MDSPNLGAADVNPDEAPISEAGERDWATIQRSRAITSEERCFIAGYLAGSGMSPEDWTFDPVDLIFRRKKQGGG